VRVLITGASGFIGRPLVERLSILGHEVLGISRSIPSAPNHSQISWLQADLSSKKSYQVQVSEFSPEIVVHLAWQDIPDFSIEKSKLNLDQSIDFISFIAKLSSCKKIIFSGSCLEYDNAKGECLENELVKGTKNHFTSAKNSLRIKAAAICNENFISFAWFRIFYVYGPGQRSESLLPSILSKLKEGRLPKINSPYNSNDYIYVDDVVNAFSKAVAINFPSGIFNLGSGVSTNVIEVCRYAEKITLNSSKLSDELEAKTDQNSSEVDFWANIEFSSKYLEWAPKINLTEGIVKTWKSLN